jgi:hypothetical protein
MGEASPLDFWFDDLHSNLFREFFTLAGKISPDLSSSMVLTNQSNLPETLKQQSTAGKVF